MTDDDPFTTLVVTALKAGKGRKKKRLGTWRTTYADIKDEKKEKKALNIKMPGQAKTTFCLKDAQVEKTFSSFLDYIFGGCEIGMQIAVDYSLSN